MGQSPDVVGEALVERSRRAAGQPFLDDALVDAGPGHAEAGKVARDVAGDGIGHRLGEHPEVAAQVPQHQRLAVPEVGEVGERVEARGDQGPFGFIGRQVHGLGLVGNHPCLGTLCHGGSLLVEWSRVGGAQNAIERGLRVGPGLWSGGLGAALAGVHQRRLDRFCSRSLYGMNTSPPAVVLGPAPQ